MNEMSLYRKFGPPRNTVDSAVLTIHIGQQTQLTVGGTGQFFDQDEFVINNSGVGSGEDIENGSGEHLLTT